MTTLGKRIQQLRKEKGYSQTELANTAGISYAQLSRYENKGAQPPAEVLKRLANALDTTVDYMISGDTEEKAKEALNDTELLRQFKEMDQLPPQEKSTLIKVISAYIRDFKAKQAYAS